MLKRIWCNWKSIPLLFIFILSISYLGITFLRVDEFSMGLKNDYEYNITKLEESKYYLEKYKHADFNKRDERLSFEGAKVQYEYYSYLILSEKYLLDNKKASLIFKLLEIYGKIHALVSMKNILLGSEVDAQFYLGAEDNCIEEWVKRGEKKEGNWWARFEKSQEYGKFISQNVLNWKNESGETIDQIYEEILDERIMNKTTILDNVLNYWVIEVEKEVARKAFKNYKDHIGKNNFISAKTDTNVLLRILEDMNRIKKLEIISYLIIDTRHLPQLDFMKTKLIFDLFYMFFISSILTFIFYYIIKKWLER